MKNQIKNMFLAFATILFVLASCGENKSAENKTTATEEQAEATGNSQKKAALQAVVDATTSTESFKKAAAESGMTLTVINDTTIQMAMTMMGIKKATADPKTISELNSGFKEQMLKSFKGDPEFEKIAKEKPHFTSVIYDEDKVEMARTEINSNEY